MSMNHLTQPEPINHNELKRLLHECFDAVYIAMASGNWAEIATSRRMVSRMIDEAILDGDDS